MIEDKTMVTGRAELLSLVLDDLGDYLTCAKVA
jgi:hypothetical protein